MDAGRPIRIAPSLAAAPLDSLADLVVTLSHAGADVLHFDLEDGHFVPGIMNLGTRLISELRSLTDLPFDVHLMVEEPYQMLPKVIAAGADMVSVHVEACRYPRRCLRMIKDSRVQAGLAINPKTPLPDIPYLLPLLDFVDILTTEPEEPDWPFLPEILRKVREVAELRGHLDQPVAIEVDGGITEHTAPLAVQAGADILVAGRAVFGEREIEENIQQLRASFAATGSTDEDA